MMQDYDVRARQLWRAVALAAEGWKETLAMLDELSGALLASADAEQRWKLTHHSDVTEVRSTGTVHASRTRWWDLTPRGRGNRRATGSLYATAALGPSSNAVMRFGERPTLVVGYVSAAIVGSDEIDGQRLDDPDFDLSDTRVSPDGRLLLGERDDTAFESDRPNWCFVVPLFALTSVDELKRQVVDPVLALLRGESLERVFPADAVALRFRMDSPGTLVLMDEEAAETTDRAQRA